MGATMDKFKLPFYFLLNDKSTTPLAQENMVIHPDLSVNQSCYGSNKNGLFQIGFPPSPVLPRVSVLPALPGDWSVGSNMRIKMFQFNQLKILKIIQFVLFLL